MRSGRASAISSAASASSASSAGMWRVQLVRAATAGQHVDVREADREPPATALGDDIGGQGEGNQRQPQQQERLLERHYFACSSASSIRGIGTFSSTSSSTRSASTPAASAS